MKYKGLRKAATVTKTDAGYGTDVAIILRGNEVTTRVIGSGNWLADTGADAIIYAKKPMTAAQIEAELSGEIWQSPQQRYDSANTMTITIKLNRTHDADIISRIEQEENRQGYIKSLIRADIQK